MSKLDIYYKHLAYCVIRDAIGFYFGIPQFLTLVNESRESAFKSKLKVQIEKYKKRYNREPTPHEVQLLSDMVSQYMIERVAELQLDFTFCEELLFQQNFWLDWLGINASRMQAVLLQIGPATSEQLAVTPTWTTSDYSLGRSYINDRLL